MLLKKIYNIVVISRIKSHSIHILRRGVINLKSIKTKMLIWILPVVLIGMMLLTYVSYFYSTSLIKSELQVKMETQLQAKVQEIEKNLQRHGKIAQSLAKVAQSSSTSLTKENYVDLLKGIITTNPETLGAGVWFEPYIYNKNIKLFGPDAYKDGNNIVYTDDYSTESYNYPSYDWYKVGKTIKDTVAWSPPYYDEVSKITMITTTAPFYDKNNTFLGVATADINLETIQKSIESMKIGETGRAFLIGKDGTYIADKDKSKVMKIKISQDSNITLADLGKALHSNKNGQSTFKDENGVNKVYYSTIPETGWSIALSIPEKELFSSINSLIVRLLLISAISVIIVMLFVFLFTNNISKTVKTVNTFAMNIAKGDLTKSIQLKSKDEFGQMVNHLNIMADNIKTILNSITENSSEMNASSEELYATVEEMTAKLHEVNENTKKISLGVIDTSAATEEITASIEEVNSSINELSQKASDGDALSREIKQRAINVQNSCKNGIDLTNKVYKEKEYKILKAIEEGKVVDEIKSLAESISNIASQTNLLALNAAIESSRAGEHGKGFAVVAEEVRKLAEQSSKTVSTIQETVVKVQEAFKSLSHESNEVLNFIDEKVTEQFNSFVDLGNQYYEDSISLHKMVENISSMSLEISATVDEVGKSIQNVSTTAEASAEHSNEIISSVDESVKGMNEVLRTAEVQSELAQKLNNMIQNFRL